MIAAPPRRIGDAQQREVSLPPDGARLAPVVLKTFFGGMTPQPYQSSEERPFGCCSNDGLIGGGFSKSCLVYLLPQE